MSRRIDIVAAVLITAWSVLGDVGLAHPWPALAAVLWVAPIGLRSVAPMAMALLSSAGILVFALVPGATAATPFLGTLVLLFLVGLELDRWRLVLALICLGTTSMAMDLLVVRDQELATRVISLLVILGGPAALGALLRRSRVRTVQLQDLHRQLTAERAARARDAAAAERNRIARDLHDVISHSVSAMVVQANAAEQQLPVNSPAREQLLAVRRTGKDTLTELRRLLGVLRESTP